MNAAVTSMEQSPNAERMFPIFTPAQVARLATLGRRRRLRHGDSLYEAGQSSPSFFVITSGQVEIVRPSASGGERLAVHGPGQFTGEANMLAGGRALNAARVVEAGEAIEIDGERLLALVQGDAEISEILMRAFILRRAYLMARGFGDAILIGSSHSAGTLRVKEFLTRNDHPYTYLDLDRETDVQAVLDRFHVTERDVPVVVCHGELVLRNPSNDAIAESLGLNPALDSAQVHDLIVVGAGPAGLAAAVYAASEGLKVLVLEERAPGGQAGSSSRIENYLGFPTGISGQALAGRALTQAQKFGAQVLIAKSAKRLTGAQNPYRIAIAGEACVRARALVIATGAEYRKPPLENLLRFEGVGVYYAATFMEAQLCVDKEVFVIGGGNSAGQAAVFLAQTCRHVHILVRSRGLAETMSRYLIRRIEEHPGITVHAHSEVVAVEGNDHLERVRWHNNESGAAETRDVEHLFVMAGAVPATRWLDGCLALDAKGFIKTGGDLTPKDLADAKWALARPPYSLETSLPGVFAVGDVRAGNVKRVASAVGEGSIAVSFVHRVLEA
jgi:thioredoxin reductase (NADPH)